MSGFHLGCWRMTNLQQVSETNRRCRSGERLDRQTQEGFSQSQSLVLHFLIPSVAWSILILFCFSTLAFLMTSFTTSSVCLLSYLSFPYSLYTSANSLKKSKISLWLHSTFKWMITMNTNKNVIFLISLTWLNMLHIIGKKQIIFKSPHISYSSNLL